MAATKSKSKSSSRKGSATTTINHDEIRQWVESRGGHPACVKGTGGGGDTGLLRIDYPGFSGDGKLQEIGWDDFFEKFDEEQLAFLYQDRTKGGSPSRFSKLISRPDDQEQKGESKKNGGGRKSSKGSAGSRGSSAKKSTASKAGVRSGSKARASKGGGKTGKARSGQ